MAAQNDDLKQASKSAAAVSPSAEVDCLLLLMKKKKWAEVVKDQQQQKMLNEKHSEKRDAKRVAELLKLHSISSSGSGKAAGLGGYIGQLHWLHLEMLPMLLMMVLQSNQFVSKMLLLPWPLPLLLNCRAVDFLDRFSPAFGTLLYCSMLKRDWEIGEDKEDDDDDECYKFLMP